MPERAYWPAWLEEHGQDDPVSRRIGAVQGLEELGAEVLVVQADVTDTIQMRDAVAQARQRFGHIDGVVHAAGIPGGGIIALKTRAQAEAVMAPKVLGTMVLKEALAAEHLDFFVHCSSFTSLLGGAGQVDYCAANAFLDAFAHEQSRTGRRAIAINWPVWQEVGMAVDAPITGHLQAAKDANLRNGMRTVEAQSAFERVLANPLPQVVVSTQDLPKLVEFYARLQQATGTGERASTQHIAEPDLELETLHSRPQVSSTFAAPTTELEEQIVTMWRTLLGIADVGIHDSFFDLGGHSLLATQLLARLQQRYGVVVPLRTVFENQTIAALAAYVDEIRSAGFSPHDGTPSSAGEREEIEI